jgi:hypothetical protein
MSQEQPQAHPAQVAQEFMRRTDMKGGEVEAYAQTFNWLQAFLDGEIVATPKEAHLALIGELQELRDYKELVEEDKEDLPVLEPEVTVVELEDVDSGIVDHD